jgi:putative ABC transport system ATP-binding protein
VTVLNASRRENPADPPSAPSGGALSIRTDGLLLDVPQGELLGIVADEADAERLVHVLATAWFADHGEVRVDDVPLTTLDAQAARRTVLVARHDAHLFAEPVRDAIGCGAGRELVRAAIEASDTAQVLDTLPDGLETLLSERGSSLSGGQHQRVALARAFAADPVVLVLQDPTTAVDAATEQRIAQGLRRLRRGRTTVVTTTSPALLSACDRVLLLTAEGIRAEGTHEQLAATQAAYRDLVMT